MKNLNDLVKNEWCEKIDISYYVERYKELTLKIDEIYKKINEAKNITGDNLVVKDLIYIRDILNFYRRDINQNEQEHLSNVILKFENTFNELKAYDELMYTLSYYQEELDDILNHITFYHINDKCSDHQFIADNNKLFCVNCNTLIWDNTDEVDVYNLLVAAALKQNLLLEEVKIDDLPLLFLLKRKKDYYKSLRKQIDLSEYDSMDYVEEYYLEDEAEIGDLSRDVIRAKILDGTYQNECFVVRRNSPFVEGESDKLLKEIDEKKIEIENGNYSHKDLLLEMCNEAKYEVMILSGKSIKDLYYNDALINNEVIAFLKAYNKLSEAETRTLCEYFKTENDAIFYDCRTADPEINKQLIKLKDNSKVNY